MPPYSEVESWIAALPPAQARILTRVRELIITTIPAASESIKWSRPCYETEDGLFCYLHASKNHATLGFERGAYFDDPKGILEGSWKNMRHVKLRSFEDIAVSSITHLLKQAVTAKK